MLLGDEDNMPEWQFDPQETPLDEILTKPKDKLTHVYDFGDYWGHDIVVKKVISLAAGHPTPAVSCPPASAPPRQRISAASSAMSSCWRC